MNNELYHHGIKGQKWGVRRYQFADGSYTPAGIKRYQNGKNVTGYNALLDYNDKEYSSYHAKRPMIVFDTDSVKLQSVSETNPKIVNKMYKKYNAERIMKEIPANTVGYITKYGSKSLSDCQSYMQRKMDSYLS